jgi:hypothetical protein
VRARVLAFGGILVAGLFGGLSGYGITDVQCHGDCTRSTAFGLLVGSVLAALGAAVVAVLVLRAMGEWRTIRPREDPAA